MCPGISKSLGSKRVSSRRRSSPKAADDESAAGVGRRVRSIHRLERSREVGEIDSRRFVRDRLGKDGEVFDRAGPILRQEIARPDRARVADGGRYQTRVGGLAVAQDYRAN